MRNQVVFRFVRRSARLPSEGLVAFEQGVVVVEVSADHGARQFAGVVVVANR